MLSSVDDYTGDFGERFKRFHCTQVILLHFVFKTAVQFKTHETLFLVNINYTTHFILCHTMCI